MQSNGCSVYPVMYPALHTHAADPSGASENGGHPWQLPESTPLNVSAGHCRQALAPSDEKVPGPHHAHASYRPAPGAAENVPFGHAAHVSADVACTASE